MIIDLQGFLHLLILLGLRALFQIAFLSIILPSLTDIPQVTKDCKNMVKVAESYLIECFS